MSLTSQANESIDTGLLILRVKDPTIYIQNDTKYFSQWIKRSAYTYSYTVPLNISEEERGEFVRKDLTKWLELLGITVKKENGKYVITEKDWKGK